MGNSISQCCTTEIKKSDITILMLGLDNAGKTTAVKNFLNEPVEDVVPTVGFSTVDMKFRKHSIKIYDLGGGANIRGIWKNYYALVHGVVFVVDSSDMERLEQMKEVIHNVLKDPRIAGKPILLLVNKQDIEGALNEVELCTALDVETVINERHCPTRVETSCALSTLHQKGKRWKDQGITDGFQWLLGHILDNFPRMNDRVGREIEQQKEQEERDRQERMLRVQKIRQERELDQAKKNGSGIVPADNDDGDNGEREHNPFRPITDFQERAERKASVGGPRVIHVSPAISPEVESLKEETSSPLSERDESKQLSLSEGDSSDNTVVILHHQPQQALSNGPSSGEAKLKRKKRKFVNRVGPGSLDCLQSKSSGELPPLKWENAKSVSAPPPLHDPQHGWTDGDGVAVKMDVSDGHTTQNPKTEDVVQVFTSNDNT